MPSSEVPSRACCAIRRADLVTAVRPAKVPPRVDRKNDGELAVIADRRGGHTGVFSFRLDTHGNAQTWSDR